MSSHQLPINHTHLADSAFEIENSILTTFVVIVLLFILVIIALLDHTNKKKNTLDVITTNDPIAGEVMAAIGIANGLSGPATSTINS